MGLKIKIALREDMVDAAASLIGADGIDNTEYMRGMAELIADVTRGAAYDEGPADDPDNAKYNVESDIRNAIQY